MMACPTLGNGPTEETGSAGHRHERGHAHTASRFAKDRDVIRVSSESSDVLLDPGESSDLVEHTEVDNVITQIEESVRSKTVVDGDTYHSIAGEATTVILWYCA